MRAQSTHSTAERLHEGAMANADVANPADRMLADLHVALRCRCCPTGGLFDAFSDLWEEPSHVSAPRALQRSDFIGLLGLQDLDCDARGTM
jgi:hypothetical protein